MGQHMTVRIEVPAELVLLRTLDLFVTDLIRRFCPAVNNEKQLNELRLAFDEAFTNIHHHAYRFRTKGPVTIEITIDTGYLEFRFEDRGAGFDPDAVATPNLDQPGEGGLGVWLMRNLMDEYVYCSTEDGTNILKLVKRFPATLE
jgi:serine/threonine-protein kinase RsbW